MRVLDSEKIVYQLTKDGWYEVSENTFTASDGWLVRKSKKAVKSNPPEAVIVAALAWQSGARGTLDLGDLGEVYIWGGRTFNPEAQVHKYATISMKMAVSNAD